jgi:hypothetical protein
VTETMPRDVVTKMQEYFGFPLNIEGINWD